MALQLRQIIRLDSCGKRMGVDIEKTVAELCGTAGDETIRTYIAAVLKLGDFDFGREGENAYDSFGPMLVSPKESLERSDYRACSAFTLTVVDI